MRTFTSFLFIIAITLSACLSPSGSAPTQPQVTVTLTPVPIPTQHPEFIALQQTIAASGTRFTLSGADGHVYDGDVPVPGLTIAPDGTMTLTVNGETVTIDPSDVKFDNEKGISAEGYNYEDKDTADDEPGDWVDAAETVTMSGVILTQDENGVLTIKEATGADADTKAENRAKVDPAAWGCEDCTMVKDKTGTHIVAEGKNIALWVGTEWVWDGQALASLEGDNPLFELAKTHLTTDDGRVLVTDEVEAEAAEIAAFTDKEMLKIGNVNSLYGIYLYKGEDKSEAIIARLFSRSKWLDSTSLLRNRESAIVDGWICFKKKSGELVRMKVNNLEFYMRGFD